MACEAMSYLRHPATSKFKKLQAQAFDILRTRWVALQNNTPMDITKAIAESWKEQYRLPPDVYNLCLAETFFHGKTSVPPYVVKKLYQTLALLLDK